LTVEEKAHKEDFFNVDTVSAKRKFNEVHRKARSRVENPFGIIDLKFSSLQKPWSEEEEQLDCVVKLALALYSEKRRRM
jgi:hypothetical protein